MTSIDDTANAMKVTGLHVSCGKFELGPIDMEIPAGTIHGLIGPNGSGKTVLMSSLLGLIKPKSGSIEVCGMEADPRRIDWKQKIGFVTDNQGFMKSATVAKNLAFYSSFYPSWDQAVLLHLPSVMILGRCNRTEIDAEIASLTAIGNKVVVISCS